MRSPEHDNKVPAHTLPDRSVAIGGDDERVPLPLPGGAGRAQPHRPLALAVEVERVRAAQPLADRDTELERLACVGPMHAQSVGGGGHLSGANSATSIPG